MSFLSAHDIPQTGVDIIAKLGLTGLDVLDGALTEEALVGAGVSSSILRKKVVLASDALLKESKSRCAKAAVAGAASTKSSCPEGA